MKPKIRVAAITQLVLDEKNANKGTNRGRELLEESLEKYGAARSVVVDRHNRVIAGNKIVEAARAAGVGRRAFGLREPASAAVLLGQPAIIRNKIAAGQMRTLTNQLRYNFMRWTKMVDRINWMV